MPHVRNAFIVSLIMLAVLAYGSCGDDPEAVSATATACAIQVAAYNQTTANAAWRAQDAWASVEAGPQRIAARLARDADRLEGAGDILGAARLRNSAHQTLNASAEWKEAQRPTDRYQNMEPPASVRECQE